MLKILSGGIILKKISFNCIFTEILVTMRFLTKKQHISVENIYLYMYNNQLYLNDITNAIIMLKLYKKRLQYKLSCEV